MNGHMFALYCPDKLTCQLVILCDFSSFRLPTYLLMKECLLIYKFLNLDLEVTDIQWHFNHIVN